MPTLSLSYVLLPFALVVLFSFLFFFFNIFHIQRYGVRHTNTRFLLFLYISVYGLIITTAALYILTVDWTTEVTLEEILPFSTSTSIEGYDYGL